MPQLTPEEIRERRENAAKRLAAGSAMIGGAAVAQHEVKQRTGVKGPIHALKDIGRGGVKAKHGKYAAGWLGTRAVTAAGLPLAVSGASNLLARKPKTEEGVDVRRDVIGGTVNAATPGTPVKPKRPDRRTLKEQATAAAPIAGGAALGGLGGRKLASRIGRGKGSKARIAGMAIGSGLGSAFGATAAVPVTRHAVEVASSGTRTYHPRKGIHEVGKAVPGAITSLPQNEQQTLIRQKKKQSKYSLASAGLGLTAFGLKSPALVASAARRSKRLSAMKPVQTFAGHAPKTDKYATNLGIASLGVGGMGSLNFARIQRAETKADQKAIKKAYRQGELHSDPEFNRHLNARTRSSLAQGRKPKWNTDQTFGHMSGSVSNRKLNALAKRRKQEPWPEDMPWSESVGDTEGSAETYRHIADHTGDYSSYREEHRPTGPKWKEPVRKSLVEISKIGEIRADQYLEAQGKKQPYGVQRTLQDVDDYYRVAHGGRSKAERIQHFMESNIEPEKARARQRKVVREIEGRRNVESLVNMQNRIRHISGDKDPTEHEFAVADENLRRRKAGQPKARYIRSHAQKQIMRKRQKAVMAHRSGMGPNPGPRPPDPPDTPQGYHDLGSKFYEKNPHPQHGNPYKKTQHSLDMAKALVSKRVLVTGSRDWDDEPAVHAQLDRLAGEHPDIEVIEGGARGADTHARNWAKARGKKVSTYQADWKAHGRSAGPRRNQRMIDEGAPERVLAFSRDLENSKGTRDMVRRAKKAGVPTEVHGQELAKALFPTKLFRPKPIRFGGVRTGGIRRTVTGRLVPYRGSVG